MKGRAALRTAGRAQAAAWLTVPLMLLPVPRWLYSLLDWGGGATALASLLTVAVILVWNLFGSREEPGTPLPPAEPAWAEGVRAMQAAVAAGSVSMSSLRYLGPPPVVTGPSRVILAGGAWGQGSPVMPSGLCGKCGEPMARHSYYGRGPCVCSPEPAGQ